MGAVQPSRRPFRDPVCPVDRSILVCQRHRPDPDYYENINRTKQDYRQAERSVSASLFAPSATTAASDGSFATASAFRRSQAVSIVDCRRLLNVDAVEPRRDDGQIFDDGDAWAAQEAAAPPEQPGVDGDRQAGNVRRRVERRGAVLVHRRRAGQTPRSLRVNEHLSSGGEHGLRGAGDLLQRLPAPPAINRDLLRDDEIEAEQRNVGELPLEDDGEVRRVFEQREGLEKRLMLGGDQDCAGRDILDAAIFEPEARRSFPEARRKSRPTGVRGQRWRACRTVWSAGRRSSEPPGSDRRAR